MKTKIQFKMKQLSGICMILMFAMHVQAQDPVCFTSSSTYQNQSIVLQSGIFEATFDATPLGNSIDVLAGLSSSTATVHSDVACAVRFKLDGTIVARKGGAWDAASTILYTPNTSYHFRLVVDIQSHIYSIYVTPKGESEFTVGTNFAFRSEQSGVSSLSYWSLSDVESHGTATVCNFAIGTVDNPTDPCILSDPSYRSRVFERQSDAFEATFTATPLLASIDVVTGFSSTAATDHSSLACAVRFTLDGTIVARNGDSWNAASTIPYTANTSYSMRFVVNTPAHTFSVYVTPQGGSEITLGTNYAFRSEQAGAASLAYWNVSDVEKHGAAKVCNLVIGAADIPVAPSCITSSSICQNVAFKSQAGTFEATFNATPLNGQPLDVVVGLSANEASSAADMSCIIRFSLNDIIIGRNGGAWSWEPYVPYTTNTKYSFRFVVDVAAKTYSIFVTPAGGNEVKIGTDYSFRVQANTLAYWSVVDVEGRGSISACDFAIGGNTAVAPNIALNVNETNLSVYPNPSDGQVAVKYMLREPGNVILSLFDSSGKKVASLLNETKEKGIHEKRYNVMEFPNGTYYIQLVHEGKSSSFKFIKQSKY